LGCEVVLAPQVPHRISPYRGAPVSPAVGNGMFTRCGNQPPVLWSTEVHFFLQRRLARHTLVLKKERTGPTAGETGPRCGRTCGATRRQRSDDRPLISNHALKKGGHRQNALALAAGRGLAWASDAGKPVFKSPSSDGPSRSDRPGVVRWSRCRPLCRSFSERAA
jgi:hypothetical protein